MFAKIANFLKEVKVELKKVTWPTRQETIKYTLLVIGVSAGVAIFLGGLDYIFQLLLSRFVL
ncbi:MAG: preprotein translocase subunit SecE [bacterium]